MEPLKRSGSWLLGSKASARLRVCRWKSFRMVHAYQAALSDGLLSTLLEAGATIRVPGSQTQLGLPQPNQRWLTTLSMNTPGKSGAGEHWLCSPVTAIASAVAGHLVNPDWPEVFIVRDSKHSARRTR